jgi:phenylpyruvate tautomerase PptA (4-oxalocrotonate tautomerase family)
MSLTHITTFEGADLNPVELVQAVRAVLVETLQVPPNDPTVLHRSASRSECILGDSVRTGGVVVEITLFAGRKPETLAQLHERVAECLVAAGVAPGKVLCVLHELPRSAWSVGGVPRDQVDIPFDINV